MLHNWFENVDFLIIAENNYLKSNGNCSRTERKRIALKLEIFFFFFFYFHNYWRRLLSHICFIASNSNDVNLLLPVIILIWVLEVLE